MLARTVWGRSHSRAVPSEEGSRGPPEQELPHPPPSGRPLQQEMSLRSCPLVPTRPTVQAQILSFLAVRLQAGVEGPQLRVCWGAHPLTWASYRRWGPGILENPRLILPRFFILNLS